MLTKLIPDAVEVKGSDTLAKKEENLLAFTDQKARVIVSKAKICGFGMNWQHCRKIAFCSISYSYERFYQAVRRSWRFGQTKPVDVHVFIADSELGVWRTIEKKTKGHDQMKKEMRHAVFKKGTDLLKKVDYNPKEKSNLPSFL
jgi:hypothetical protein